jgi:hypothetical protein
MALEMRSFCEKCNALLDSQGEAYICSFECTFCPACAQALNGSCPNCGGELVRRPKRKAALVVDVPHGASTEAEPVTADCPVAG